MQEQQRVTFSPYDEPTKTTFSPTEALAMGNIEKVDKDEAVLASMAFPQAARSVDEISLMSPDEYERFLGDNISLMRQEERKAATEFAMTALEAPDPETSQATLTVANAAMEQASRLVYPSEYKDIRDEQAAASLADMSAAADNYRITEQERAALEQGHVTSFFLQRLDATIKQRWEQESFLGKSVDFFAGLLTLPEVATSYNFKSNLQDAITDIRRFEGTEQETIAYADARIKQLFDDWSNTSFTDANLWTVKSALADVTSGQEPLVSAGVWAGLDLATLGVGKLAKPASRVAKAAGDVKPAGATKVLNDVTMSPDAAKMAEDLGMDVIDIVAGTHPGATTVPGANHLEAIFGRGLLNKSIGLTPEELAKVRDAGTTRITELLSQAKLTQNESILDFNPLSGELELVADVIKGNGTYFRTKEEAIDAARMAGLNPDRYAIGQVRNSEDKFVIRMREQLAPDDEISLSLDYKEAAKPVAQIRSEMEHHLEAPWYKEALRGTTALAREAGNVLSLLFRSDSRLPDTDMAQAMLGSVKEAQNIQARAITALTNEISDALGKLPRAEHKLWSKAVEWSGDNNRWITSQSKFSEVFGMPASENVWQAYQAFRKLDEVNYFFKNTAARMSALRKGYSGYSVRVVDPDTKQSVTYKNIVARELDLENEAVKKKFMNGNFGDVWDIDANRAVDVSKMTDEQFAEFIEGARVLERLEFSAFKSEQVKTVISRDAGAWKRSQLPEQIAPYMPGGRRFYQTRGQKGAHAFLRIPLNRKLRDGTKIMLRPATLFAGFTPKSVHLLKKQEDVNAILGDLGRIARGEETKMADAELTDAISKQFGDDYDIHTIDDLNEYLAEQGADLRRLKDDTTVINKEGDLPDEMLGYVDSDNNWAMAQTNWITGRVRRDKPLPHALGGGTKVIHATQQMERLVHDTGKMVAFGNLRENMLERWDNTFGDMFEGNTPFERLQQGRLKPGADSARTPQAKLARSKVRQLMGVRSALGKVTDNWMTDVFTRLDDAGFPKLAAAFYYPAGSNPSKAFRSINSLLMLGLFNPGQFIIQSTTAATVVMAKMTTDPALAVKAARDGWMSLAGLEFYKKTNSKWFDAFNRVANFGLNDNGNLATITRHMHEMNITDVTRTHSLGDTMIGLGLDAPVIGVRARQMGQKAAYYASAGFVLAERLNRATAFSLAYRQAMKEFGLKTAPRNMTNEFRQRVAYLTDNYNLRMTQASQSAIEESLLGSIAFQFQSYMFRYLEAILSGKNNPFTARERVALAAAPFAFAGSSAYMIGDWSPTEWVTDYMINQTGAQPDPKTVENLSKGLYTHMVETIPGAMANMLYGEPMDNTNLDLDKRTGLSIPVLSQLQALFWADRDPEDVFFGPSGSMIVTGKNSFKNAFMAMFATPHSDTSFMERLGTAGIELSRVSTGINNVVQGSRQLKDPNLRATTRSGFVMPGTSRGDTWAHILGIGPARTYTNYFKAAGLTRRYSEEISEIAKQARVVYDQQPDKATAVERLSAGQQAILMLSEGDGVKQRRALESFYSAIPQNKLRDAMRQARNLNAEDYRVTRMREALQEDMNRNNAARFDTTQGR